MSVRVAGRRRAVALAAVLLVIALGALVGTTAVYFASAEYASTSATARRVQARALAWSGVQSATDEVWRQRLAILAGESPRLEREGVLFEDGPPGAGTRGVYRLRIVGGEDCPYAAAEAGLVDANSASAERLSALGLGPALAEEIVSRRKQRPLGSVAEALSLVSLGWNAGGVATGAGGVSGSGLGGGGEQKAAGTPSITVFAFDPQVSGGASKALPAGEPRWALGAGWTREVEAGLGAALTPKDLAAVKGVIEAAARGGEGGSAGPGTAGALASRLLGAGVTPEGVTAVLDAIAVGDGAFRVGLVDVSRAAEGVLAGVPGFDAETAAKAVRVRRGLSAAERASVCWLIEKGVLTPEAFAKAVDHVTHRTMQWRVVVDAGVAGAEGSSGGGGGAGGGGIDAEAALRDRVTLEAVIDVSGGVPRVAYLRDVSMREAAAWLDERGPVVAAEAGAERTEASTGEARRGDGAAAPEPPPVVTPAPAQSGGMGATVERKPRATPGGRVGRWTTGGG